MQHGPRGARVHGELVLLWGAHRLILADPRTGRLPPYPGAVRLVFARCSVDYVGRLTAHLPEATRLLVHKADGSLLVHSDTGGYKPLMWIRKLLLHSEPSDQVPSHTA
jgi:hypothetical protein